MPSNEVKHRKAKSGVTPNGDTADPSTQGCKEETKKDGGNQKKPNNWAVGQSCVLSSLALDVRTIVTCLSLGACFVLGWVVLQQNDRFIEVEEKYRYLYEKAAHLLVLEERFSEVSKKCENAQVVQENQETRASLSRLSTLEQEVIQLREWTSAVAERRKLQQENLAELTRAVERIENRTTAISSDVAAKVTSVRTDVRRMAGLEGEVGDLLTQAGALEEKLAQAERLMVKRVAELLASSIDRISNLKSSVEKNTQSLEQIRRRLPELAATDEKIFDGILALESGRAKVMRTVTFASDLRPKVFTVKRDLALLEPQVTDLTLRIGQLAEDVMKREEDIMQIKESLASFIDLRGGLKQTEEEPTAKPIPSDVRHQNDPHTHTD